MVHPLALTCVTLCVLSNVAACQAPAPARTACVIARVSDGDTFHCTDGTKVRMLTIDSPERGQGPSYGQATRALTRYLGHRRTVQLERDVRPLDQYGRTLAYVWAGDTLVNEAMVRDGWAVLYTLPPNVRYVDRIRRAERDARQHTRGLWADGEVSCRPAAFRRHQCP